MFKRPFTAIWPVVLLAAALLQTNDARAASPGEMQTGSLLMQMAEGYETATLLNTGVNIDVNGLVARVSVMQEFKNEGNEWVEGIYVFPLPDEAAVDHMRLYVGERFIEGEIREKEQARKEYEQAKQQGKKTSLVEQQRANLFTTSVANIGPGETVIVEIEYLENIRYDDGVFSLRFPMTLTPRYIPGTAVEDKQGSGWSPDTTLVEDASLITPPMVGGSRGHRVSLQARINAGVPLEIIASRYHPVNVGEATGYYTVSLAGGRVKMDHDFELLWRPVPSEAPRGMMFTETKDGAPYYLLMVMPPNTGAAVTARMPREMIFIVDTSGSMHGVSIEQARKALLRAIDGLQPGDMFNVIEFNSYPNALFNSSVPADTGNLATAKTFVTRLEATGGTEMRAALQHALKTPPSDAYLRQVIFITDGAVGNEAGLFELIADKLGSARLFTVGIGSAPNSWFMRKAAETGRGTFTTISALHEVGEKMDRLFRKLEHPQVTNIELQWPGGTIVETYPSVIPDLYLGEPVSVRVKATGQFRPGAEVRVAGNSVAGAWTTDLLLSADAQSSGVAALWARARIADLLDKERRGANPDEIRDEIVKTALTHHLVSKHTSLVAVDKTPSRLANDPLRKDQVPNLMAHGQSSRAIFGFPATATDAPALRKSGLLTLLAAMLILGMSAWQRKVHRGLARQV
ncbi:MAG: marine proteobacterial sortase target protein [Woeseiaceae bacterium]|jgi:Ca-activated chloride channel family protein